MQRCRATAKSTLCCARRSWLHVRFASQQKPASAVAVALERKPQNELQQRELAEQEKQYQLQVKSDLLAHSSSSIPRVHKVFAKQLSKCTRVREILHLLETQGEIQSVVNILDAALKINTIQQTKSPWKREFIQPKDVRLIGEQLQNAVVSQESFTVRELCSLAFVLGKYGLKSSFLWDRVSSCVLWMNRAHSLKGCGWLNRQGRQNVA